MRLTSLFEPTARGFVAFSIPFTKDYLLANKSEILARYGVVMPSTC